MNRVSRHRKNGIWMLIFSRGGDLSQDIKKYFFTREIYLLHRKTLNFLKIKAYSKTGGGIQLQYFGFEASFGLRDTALME